MNTLFEEIVKKLTREIDVAPYMDTVLIDLVQQGCWSEITIDYFPNKNVINLMINHTLLYIMVKS